MAKKKKKSVRRGTRSEKPKRATRAKPTKAGDGHSTGPTHDTPTISDNTQAGIVLDTPINLVPPEFAEKPSGGDAVNPIVTAMADLYRRKRYAYNTRQSSLQPAYALARQLMRVGAIENASERKKACDNARKMVDAIADGDEWTEDVGIAQTIREMIDSVSLAQTVATCTATIKAMESNMESQLKQLPIYDWVKSVRGCGVVNVCNVIGVAGDFGSYQHIGALFRKFGLAEPSSYKDITTNGKTYNSMPRERRAVMWNVGDCLIKQNFDPIPKGLTEEEKETYQRVPNMYRLIYVDRKVFYAEKYPDATKLHTHRRAQRKMEKEWLRDFYQEWKRVM